MKVLCTKAKSIRADELFRLIMISSVSVERAWRKFELLQDCLEAFSKPREGTIKFQ